MADEIARLVLAIESGQVKIASKELDKLDRQSVKNEVTNTKLVSSFKSLALGVGSLIGVSGVSGLLYATKSALDFGDAIGKAADKVGLSTDALQQFRYAADLAGVGSETLDMAMQRFSRRVGEATNGTGELKQTLEDLNISTRNTDGTIKSVEQIFYEYTDAINAAESSQEKLRLAFKAFDSEGAALVNLTREGSAGIRELGAAAKDAGAIMDERLIRQAELINDKWTVVSNTIGVKFKSAMIETAGVVLEVFGIYSDLAGIQGRIIELQNNILELEARRQGKRRGILNEQEGLAQMRAELADLEADQERIFAQYRRLEELKAGFSGDGSGPSAIPTVADKVLPDPEDDPEIKYAEFINDELFRLAEQRNIELGAIAKYGVLERLAFEQKSMKAQVSIISGELENMTRGVAQHNRVLFNLNKAAGITNAIINTWQGVSKALAFYPPPLSFAMAAAQAAAGFATVNAIRSTQFEGGGGAATAGGVAPSVAATGGVPTTEVTQDSTSDQSAVTVQVIGDVYGYDDFIDAVTDAISSAVNDRDVVIIDSTSRQALELA